jgi:hypothetical protein
MASIRGVTFVRIGPVELKGLGRSVDLFEARRV